MVLVLVVAVTGGASVIGLFSVMFVIKVTFVSNGVKIILYALCLDVPPRSGPGDTAKNAS
jgi:hypothetical protein